MNNILITGGAGYIGSKITSDLIKRKHRVIIVDSLITGHKSLINKKAIFYRCNISNEKKIDSILKKYKIDSIIHCAASVDVSESERNPSKYFRNNSKNTEKLLNVCSKNRIKNFIFSSTCAVYGNVSGIVTEQTKTMPFNVYGKSKLKCENFIKSYAKKNNFNYAILRYFNVAGSDLKNKLGCINNYNQLIKNLAISVLKKKNKISVYGNDYMTPDGTCIRDFIFINDISKIHCEMLKIMSDNKKSYLLNCGYGTGYSVLQIIKKFEYLFKLKIKIKFVPRRKGDISDIIASTKKLNKFINLNKKNKLKEIILTTLKWEKFLIKK